MTRKTKFTFFAPFGVVALFAAYMAITSMFDSALAGRSELRIPPLIDSREARHDIVLSIQNGEHEFFPGVLSATKGFSGSYLGPAIRLYDGEDTRIRFINDINEPTTVHGHGLHVAGDVDGGPQNRIEPGSTWDITLPIRQQAGMSWYHPHLMGKTAEHVHAGLAGIYLIEDENSLALDLPKRYGIDDIPLVVQDRDFTKGKMDPYSTSEDMMMDGPRAATLVVNGTVGAYKSVPKGWIRLRVLNGSNARFYRFYFQDHTVFYKIATEGGFLESPVQLSEMVMAPGERNEIMIDLASFDHMTLMAEFLPADPEDDVAFGLLNEKQAVVELRTDATLQALGQLPGKLNTMTYLSRRDAVKTRTFQLRMEGGHETMNRHEMFSINGRPLTMNYINERVKKGQVEIWRITAEMMPHPFHIHGVSFQILSHNGVPPAAEDRGWKDTVIVTEEPTDLIMQFNHEATEEYPYMYHCHILEHEDGGMMGQFTVQ